MSHTTLESVSMAKRGSSMRLSFVISCHKDYSSNIETETYSIGDDLAQFYLEFIYSKSSGTISPRIYSTTPSMRHNSSIIMSLKYANPKIFNEWVCGSEWTHLSLEPVQKSSCYSDKIIYEFKIMVTVNEEKIEPLHAQVYEDEHFTDFNLVGVNGNVAVHKVVLAASSPVFKAMLLGKWKETTEATIELAGITLETLQHLKEFMYLGILPDKKLEPLLLLAKCYIMDNLKTKCMKKLIGAITCDNIYTSLEFACENNLPELSAEILHFTSLYPEIAEKAYINKTASPIPTSPQEEEKEIQTNKTGEGN